jgi:uncharacterized metal-binding protein YceD (DUF177 family)
MMGSNSEFDIPFEGLKLGKHSFDLEMTEAFFTDLADSMIERGNVRVSFVLDKRETMMVGDFEMEGCVVAACDRCTDLMEVPVRTSAQIVFKFGDEPSEDENLVVIESHEFNLKLAPLCYELLVVSLPARIVHPEGECNEEMLALINQYSGYEYIQDEVDNEELTDEEVDPRWEALKNFKKK